jgi:hypothetical protein
MMPNKALDIVNKRVEPKDDTEVAAAWKTVLTPNDPDSMTDAERAAWWESEYRRLAKEDLAAREALAKILRCPAAWRYLMPEILKRIQ